MQDNETLTGVLLDDAALTLEELARAVDVAPDWVIRHVHAGVLGGEPGDAGTAGIQVASVQVTTWRFRSHDLQRARRLLGVERDFDANEQLAALVVDMADEIRRLRARMRAIGVSGSD
jgi:chaperone modulatory protein CbpM